MNGNVAPLLETLSTPSDLNVVLRGHGGYIAGDQFISIDQLCNDNIDVDTSQSMILVQPLYIKLRKKEDAKVFYRGQMKTHTYDKILFGMDVFAPDGDNVLVFLIGGGRNECIFDACLPQRDSGEVGVSVTVCTKPFSVLYFVRAKFHFHFFSSRCLRSLHC